MSEKPIIEHADVASLSEKANVKVKVAQGSGDLNEILLREPVIYRSKRTIQLCLICSLFFLGSTMGGFDGSLMGALLVMKPFQDTFGANILGVKTGIISSMYAIGAVCALPFVGPFVDTWGRRRGIHIATVFLVLGVLLQGCKWNFNLYMAGRFFLGFGGTISNVASPSLVAELAHPAYRGVITGLYNTCYYLGSILASATVRGTVHYPDNRCWLIPTWLQLVFPILLALGAAFFPESPRWLYVHGKLEDTKKFLVKYHGNDNPDSLYVGFQLEQFEKELDMDGADKRFWDYRCLFNSKASFYRAVLCSAAISAFSQWTGQGTVSYFLAGMLTTAGVTAENTVLNYNLGIAITSGFAAVTGASLIDRLGRRRALMGTTSSLTVLWALMAACTGVYKHNPDSTSAAKASIAFIFLIGIVFSFAYTPLQALYPVEVLSYEQRAKGMALQQVAGNAASLVIQFAMPVALQRIEWKTYFVFVAFGIFQTTYYYFIMVETNGYTLEELSEIFEQKNPRKASTQKAKLVVDVDHNTVIGVVEDAEV